MPFTMAAPPQNTSPVVCIHEGEINKFLTSASAESSLGVVFGRRSTCSTLLGDNVPTHKRSVSFYHRVVIL